MMNTMDPRTEKISKAAEYISSRLGNRRPAAGIVLGSGLGKLADKIQNPVVIPYKDIPGFPESTAVGHKGNFIGGELGGKFVVAMQGRFHYYEGYPMELVTLPVRVMKMLGIGCLFVSNAAGGVNFDYRIGDLMIIRDHINLLPNPLVGKNMDDFGPRFPDMTRPYDPGLIKKAEIIASELNLVLRKGVYLAGTGPSYETPSEVIVARHSGIPVFGMSVITNEAHDDYAEDYVNDGDAVVRAADAAADRMTMIFTRLIESLPEQV